MSDIPSPDPSDAASPPATPAPETSGVPHAAKRYFLDDWLGLPVRKLESAVVLALALWGDFCLYKAPGGTGAGLVLLLAVMGLVAVQRGRPTRASWVFLSITVLSALLMTWRQWWLLHFVGWLSLFLATLRWKRAAVPTMEAFFTLPVTLWLGPFRLIGHLGSLSGIRGRTFPSIPWRRILIPLAVCGGFLLIFANANPVISRFLDWVGSGVETVFLEVSSFLHPLRLFVWVLWLVVFAALLRPWGGGRWMARWLQRAEGLQQPDEPMNAEGEEASAIAWWTLVSVNALFFLYNVTDAVYLYFKATLPEGINWTEYTHRGCGWLTFGLIMSSVVIGSVFRGGLNFHAGAVRLKQLAYVWAFQNAVLGVGALRRLQMYIDHSGLTPLRITGLYGSLLVLAGLGIMLWKVRRDRNFLWLVRRYVEAFCLALALLALTPVGWWCASYNAARIAEHKPRALRPVFLKDLPPDALPPLIPLLEYERPDDPARERMVREGMAALLGQYHEQLKRESDVAWTRRQGAARWALRELEEARPRIDAILPQEEWPAALEAMLADYDLSNPSGWRRSRYGR